MTEPTDALLPCPFCGGSVELEETTSYYNEMHGNRQWWGVVCRNTTNRGGSCAIQQRPSASKEAAVERWNRRTPQPTQTQAGAVPPPWMEPGAFFGGRPPRAMDIDSEDFYGITEAIHQALEMLENHSAAGTDSSPLDPKRSRRLRQALMAAWLLEYPDEAVHHGIKGGQHG